MSFYEHFTEQEIAILRERAERIANTQTEVEHRNTVSALVIQAGGETYGLPMDSLMAVYMEHTIIPVPCVPPYVAGIANIRGEIMPVFDLAVLLKAPVSETKHALIVASSNENSIAFCVEAVGESRTIQLSTLQTVPPLLNEAYLQGISSDGMALLNVEGIINDPALVVDETIS